MAITDETRVYTEQEINQIVEQIDKMHLTSRNEGELLFRCMWVIRQLQESKCKIKACQYYKCHNGTCPIRGK